jgi:hypothetical protein
MVQKALRLAKCCNLNASEFIDSLWDELEALLTLCNRKDFRFSCEYKEDFVECSSNEEG